MAALVAMISYQANDAAAAELLHIELALHGMVAVHDRCTFTSGTRTQQHMRTGVDECDAFVAYLTPNLLYLSSPVGSPRPALDEEFKPVMERRRRELGRPDAAARQLRPVVVALTHGLGDPRRDAPDMVRRATGEDISSLWTPALDQTTTSITQPEAASAASGVVKSLLPAGLGPDSGPLEVAAATRCATPVPRTITIDGTPLLGGTPPRPGEPADWKRFHDALVDLEATLAAYGANRDLEVHAKTHLSGAVAFGRVFSQAARWQLHIQGRHGTATHSDTSSHPGLMVGWDDGTLGSRDMSVEIDLLGHTVTKMTNDLIAALPNAVCGRLQIVRDAQNDLSPKDIGAMANTAAVAIRTHVAAHRPVRLHLLCAAPVEFGILLGHRLTSLHAELHLYERDGDEYAPSLVVPA